MSNEINGDTGHWFVGYSRIKSPEVIISRIKSIKEHDEKYTHVCVDVNQAKDFTFQFTPDMDSFQYNEKKNTIECSADGGRVFSSISLSNAEICHCNEAFDSTDNVNEYYMVMYPSGVVITFAIVRAVV